MRIVPDNAHCMKHARSYPMDRECPHCKLEKLQEQSALSIFKKVFKCGAFKGPYS